jgi:hypothetical protein
MGWGETYMNDWIRVLSTMSLAERNIYAQVHPAPDSWPNWYASVEQLLRTCAEDKAWIAANRENEKKLAIKRPWWKLWS